MIAMGLVPVATADFPDPPEDIFEGWLLEDDPADAASGSLTTAPRTAGKLSCALMSGDPTNFDPTEVDPENPGSSEGPWNSSPCEVLSYSIGHTDEYVYFRWTMATLEFNDQFGDQFTLYFDQAFRGDHKENEVFPRNFEFTLRVTADGAEVQSAQARTGDDSHEDWADDILVGIDRAAGTLTAALPLGLLETRVGMELDSLVGENFFLTRALTVNVVNEWCYDIPLLENCLGNIDVVEVDRIEQEGALPYRIAPFGDLLPAVVEETIRGETVTVELDLERDSWYTHRFIWDASLLSGFDLDFDVDIEGGTVDIAMLDADGGELFSQGSASGTGSGGADELEPGQEWTLSIEMRDFVKGNITVTLNGIPWVPPAGENSGGGDQENEGTNGPGEGENGDGNVTNGADVDDERTPAPAGAVLVVTVLAAIHALRRRR